MIHTGSISKTSSNNNMEGHEWTMEARATRLPPWSSNKCLQGNFSIQSCQERMPVLKTVESSQRQSRTNSVATTTKRDSLVLLEMACRKVVTHLRRAVRGEGRETFLQETFQIMLNSTSTRFQIKGKCLQTRGRCPNHLSNAEVDHHLDLLTITQDAEMGGGQGNLGPTWSVLSDQFTEPCRPSAQIILCVWRGVNCYQWVC